MMDGLLITYLNSSEHRSGIINYTCDISLPWFPGRDFDGGGRSTFSPAKNDGGIRLAQKSTNFVHKWFLYYINDNKLKNKF